MPFFNKKNKSQKIMVSQMRSLPCMHISYIAAETTNQNTEGLTSKSRLPDILHCYFEQHRPC